MAKVIGEVYTMDDIVVQWKIEGFWGLSVKNDKEYDSPSFSFNNASWHLSMYPNGAITKLKGNISLYITREFSGPPISVEYSLGLKTVDGEIVILDNNAWNFQKAEGYGTPKLLSRSELFERKSELTPRNAVTIICTLKDTENFKGLSKEETTRTCSYCKVALDLHEDVSSHLEKCEFPTKCPKCGGDVALKNWHDHKCQMMAAAGFRDTVTAKCSYCKTGLDAHEDISSHLQKCTEFPIKCLKCDNNIALKNWYDHDCQTAGAEGKNASWSSTVPHESKILEDFKQLFLKQENCDVVLRVKGKEFPAHKAILQARSPVFASTFLHDMKEKATGMVNIEDCDPSVFPDFLRFLYCKDLDNISKESIFSLFTLADKYDVSDLRFKCVEFMKENLSIDTFCDTISLAVQHCETGLVELATNFFIKNAEKIIVTVKWQTFAAENPTQSNELFIKFVASVKYSNV